MMTQQDANRRPAATFLAQRILERLDPNDSLDPLAAVLRAALADPDGTRLDRLDSRVEVEKEKFFTLLQPYLETDPALKAAYYTTDAPPDLVDAEHHAAILRCGQHCLELLERVAALPPSGVETERQGRAIARASANLGGMLAEGLMRRLPELASHYHAAEASVDDLRRAGRDDGEADQAFGAVERDLTYLRGAIVRETVSAVFESLEGILDLDQLVLIGAAGGAAATEVAP
jgi:hypothetical protein